MRAAIREALTSSPALVDLAHAAGVEALAASATMAGRSPAAVADAIRHVGVKAAAGAWARNRIEGAVARAAQFAKLPDPPRNDRGDAPTKPAAAPVVVPPMPPLEMPDWVERRSLTDPGSVPKVGQWGALLAMIAGPAQDAAGSAAPVSRLPTPPSAPKSAPQRTAATSNEPSEGAA
jgi:hypothetical protein